MTFLLVGKDTLNSTTVVKKGTAYAEQLKKKMKNLFTERKNRKKWHDLAPEAESNTKQGYFQNWQ